MAKGFGFSGALNQGQYRRTLRRRRSPVYEDFVVEKGQVEGHRDRLNIVRSGSGHGIWNPYYETSGWNDGCCVHDASESGRCDTSTRFGRRPRLDPRGVVDEREEKLIEADLTHLGLAFLDRVARQLGLYRVSWQHVEGVHWGSSRSMWSSPMHSLRFRVFWDQNAGLGKYPRYTRPRAGVSPT